MVPNLPVQLNYFANLMIKEVPQNSLESIWYHSEPSKVPYYTKKKLVANFYHKFALVDALILYIPFNWFKQW